MQDGSAWGPNGMPEAYKCPGLKPYVEKALRIARGFILRGRKDSMLMFNTIGLNSTTEVEAFVVFNGITSAQDFGATTRSAACCMIGKFGLDGRRLRIVGMMEPSKMTLNYVKPKKNTKTSKKRKNAEEEEDEE